MRKSWLGIVAAIAIGCENPATGTDPSVTQNSWLQYETPEHAGWSSERLDVAFRHAESIGSGAVMVVQGDAVVAAWGDIRRKFRAHSIRKMMLSALYGIAIDEGFIDLSATLDQLGVDDISALSAQEKQATVQHLLMSASGVYHPAVSQEDTPPPRHSQPPGAVFWYNNWDFNTLGRIYNQLTGRSLFVALEQRIAAPVGMEDFDLADTFYEFERHKTLTPAYHLRLSTRDLARFGLLMMRGGNWRGQEVVPADWVIESTRAQIPAGTNLSFGYMWWVLEAGFFEDHPAIEAVLASGTGGQRLVFVPELDVIIVHRADTDYSRGVSPTWPLINLILTARTSEPDDNANLGPLIARPFSRSLPPLNLPVRTVVADALLDRYVGKYETLQGSEVPAGLELCVEKLEDFLVLYIPAAAAEADFFPEADTRFFTRGLPVRLVFEMDGERVTGLTITDPADGETIDALRVISPTAGPVSSPGLALEWLETTAEEAAPR